MVVIVRWSLYRGEVVCWQNGPVFNGNNARNSIRSGRVIAEIYQSKTLYVLVSVLLIMKRHMFLYLITNELIIYQAPGFIYRPLNELGRAFRRPWPSKCENITRCHAQLMSTNSSSCKHSACWPDAANTRLGSLVNYSSDQRPWEAPNELRTNQSVRQRPQGARQTSTASKTVVIALIWC